MLAGKGLALAAGKPLIAVNHLEGHALSPMLAAPDLAFPYLLLLVSGGHCQLLLVEGVGAYPEVFDSSEEVTAFRIRFRVMTLDALIRARRAAGGPKDLAQIPTLEALADLKRNL